MTRSCWYSVGRNRASEVLQAEVSRAEADFTRLIETQEQIESNSIAAQEDIRILNQKISGMSLDEAQEQVSYWKTRAAVAEQSLEDVKSRRDERQIALTRLLKVRLVPARATEAKTGGRDELFQCRLATRRTLK